jgi:hypothetical protein
MIRPWLIYLIGILPFSFFYYAVKDWLGAGLFFVLAAVYLLCLRQLSIYVAAKISRPKDGSDVRT